MTVTLGTKALVLDEQILNYVTGDPLNNILFNKTVVLPEAVTETTNTSLILDYDGSTFGLTISPAGANIRTSGELSLNVRYTSTDGITYNGTSLSFRDYSTSGKAITSWEEPLSFGSISEHSGPNLLDYFIRTEYKDFKGLFTVEEGTNYRKATDITGKLITLPIDLSTYKNAASELSSGQYVILYRKSENILYLVADNYIHKTADNKIYLLRWTTTSYHPTVYKYDLNLKLPIEEKITWEVPQKGYLLNSKEDDIILLHNARLYPNLDWASGQTATSYNVNPFVQGTCWKNLDIGCNTPSNVILPGYTVLTNNGLVTGELGTKVETVHDLMLINDILCGMKGYAPSSISFSSTTRQYEYLPVFKMVDTSNFTSFSNLLQQFTKLKEFDLGDLKFDGVTGESYQVIGGFFNNNTSLETIYNIDKINDLDNPDKYVGTKYDYYGIGSFMQGCSSLKTVTGIEKLQCKRAGGYTNFMKNCSSMEIINLASLVSDKVSGTNIYSEMFMGCSKARQILLPKFNFANCKNSKSTSYNRIFSGCSSLELLDLRSSSFNSLPTTTDMFKDVPTDCLIICKDSAAKNYILSVRSDFTNIKTLAEYEG